MQVRLLGPVDVMVDGESRPVRGLRRKAVLAVLALHLGEVVGTSRLAELVWDGAMPGNAVNTLQVHVSYLRGVLGSRAAIRSLPPGYVLDPGPEGTDVRLAERLLREGTRAAEPAVGVLRLREALALWRGRPLADTGGVTWLDAQAGNLEGLRMRLQDAMLEARLKAGEHVTLVPELEQLAAVHPLDERITAQLMLALYRTGRQADALAVARRLRHGLGEALGLDPGHAVRDLETAILRQDPALEASPPAALMTRVPPPAQLPPAVSGFAGRQAELASLDAILALPGHDGPVVISAVSGTAGVGKTALAVTWAHRVAGRFPDGQLYVNLRGFHPVVTPVTPGKAVRGFLDALGVPAQRIPSDLAEASALYRSLLSGRRILVVLDNAKDAEQVRPLIPGTPGCLAVVTSRNRLLGLLATEGARPLMLDLLTAADARELLARRLGHDRTGRDPQAADEIIKRCARLPLALAVTAASAAARPGLPLADVAAELRQASSALDPFGSGERDPITDLRAVFTWSYRALSDGAARLFRLLGLHPGPDIGVSAAASLAALPGERTRALLTELASAHLLAQHAGDRYACHDLLRAYAAELAHACDDAGARGTAVLRLLGHYLHTARAASLLLEPYDVALSPPPAGVVAGEPATERDAMSWFAAEHPTLLESVRLAAREDSADQADAALAGLSGYAWQLATTLTPFHLRRGLWDDQAGICQTAMAAARRAGDSTGQAYALLGLAAGYARSGRFPDALPRFLDSLRLFEAEGDVLGQARIHGSLAWLAERDERYADALGQAMRALELFTMAGHRAGQAVARNDIGYCHALLGNYWQGIAYCEQALADFREVGEHDWEAATWDSLGFIRHRLGDHTRAAECYERSAALYRQLADQFNEADTLDHLGEAQHSAGDADAARLTWTRALRILDDIGHPDAARVRARLGPPRDAGLNT